MDGSFSIPNVASLAEENREFSDLPLLYWGWMTHEHRILRELGFLFKKCCLPISLLQGSGTLCLENKYLTFLGNACPVMQLSNNFSIRTQPNRHGMSDPFKQYA